MPILNQYCRDNAVSIKNFTELISQVDLELKKYSGYLGTFQTFMMQLFFERVNGF